MGNYLQNMSLSTLLYDLVDQHTFDCLLAQFEGVLKTPGQDDERTKKRLRHRSRSLSPRKDIGADEVRQLSLAMFSPLTGPFGCVLAAVDGVRLTVVNCIDHVDSGKDPIDAKKVRPIHAQSLRLRFRWLIRPCGRLLCCRIPRQIRVLLALHEAHLSQCRAACVGSSRPVTWISWACSSTLDALCFRPHTPSVRCPRPSLPTRLRVVNRVASVLVPPSA
jgi:hypothetical protein